jgi:hypothetical protein
VATIVEAGIWYCDIRDSRESRALDKDMEEPLVNPLTWTVYLSQYGERS